MFHQSVFKFRCKNGSDLTKISNSDHFLDFFCLFLAIKLLPEQKLFAKLMKEIFFTFSRLLTW